MMAADSMELSPDGFTGAILGVEGIRDAAVLLNGPTGCKFYHGALSDGRFPRDSSMDPLQFSDEFYFGQPRVPATYLDDHDYVFGATAKLEKILPRVAEKGHRLIAVVNSPGAALIGDDLERFIAAAGLPVPCIAVESTGFSSGFAKGFQASVIQALQRLAPREPVPAQPRQVNLVGLSIFHRHWEGDVHELRRLLSLCGIGVKTVLSAGCTTAELASAGAAALNVTVHPEFAGDLCDYLGDSLGRPVLAPGAGAPIGFEETERWITGVCRSLDADPAPALADIRRARRRAYDALSRFNALTGLPKGAAAAVRADGGMLLPLVAWLYRYLGMVPAEVWMGEHTRAQADALEKFLAEIGCADAWRSRKDDRQIDIAFGGEDFISRFRARGLPVAGVDIALPARGDIEILHRCQVGTSGALWLLESILNGLMAAA